MPARDTARRAYIEGVKVWRRLPEPWRQTFFEKAPGAPKTAARIKDAVTTRNRTVPVARPSNLLGARSARQSVAEQEPEQRPYFKLREQDIHTGYRLLLYRNPSPEEVEHHLEQGTINLEYDMYHFGDLLLSSPERKQAIARLDDPEQATLDGLIFHYRPIDTALGAMVAYLGAYETEVAAAIEKYLPKGGTFIDVGANIGLHTLRGARAVGADGKVIAFEPNPNNVDLLRMSMEINNFDQVTIRPVAVADKPGELPLHARRGQSNATIETAEVNWDSDLQVNVPTVRLDDELGDLDRLDLLKIDIEGAEPLAFTGMADTLARLKPRILMEVFPDALRRTAGVEPADFLATVEAIGYRLLPMVPGQGEPTEVYSIDDIVALPAAHKVTHVDVLAEPI